MKHYLNVCDVNGALAEPVDVITFGSPCQDLSVAGKRKGLKHESSGDEETTRSGLFIEAVRIIKEMRKHDELEQLRGGGTNEFIRPRFAIWENVPGAFSSNNGQDFRIVLEELARIKDREISIPMPESGKWKQAGEIIGGGWSIAWRTLDAQFHGVPQRRRRIFLVCDFASECAGEILFECEGLRGYPSTCGEEGQGSSDSIEKCPSGTSEKAYTLKFRGGVERDSSGKKAGKGPLVQDDLSATLSTSQDQTLFQPICVDMGGGKSSCYITENVSPTLTCTHYGEPSVCTEQMVAIEGNGSRPSHLGDGYKETNTMYTLNATEQHGVAYNDKQVVFGISSYDSNSMKSSNPNSGVYEATTSRTLDLNGGNPACNQGGMAICEAVAYREKSTCEPFSIENHAHDSRIGIREDGTVQTLTGSMGSGGNNVPLVGIHCPYQKTVGSLMASGYEKLGTQEAMNWDGTQVAGTLTSHNANGSQRMPDKQHFNCVIEPMCVCEPIYAIDRASFNQGENAQYNFQINDDGVTQTLVAKGPGAVCYGFDPGATRDVGVQFYEEQSKTLANGTCPGHHTGVVEECANHYIVRRLTPTECARLQGMPDEWCSLPQITDMNDEDLEFWNNAHKTYAEINNKKFKPKTKEQMITWYNKLRVDSAEYKAYGNGMALPCVRVPVHGVAKHGARTMASLFDGIGGFPLAGVLDGIECKWTSEIELFPIAVTKARFEEYEKYGYFTYGKEQ